MSKAINRIQFPGVHLVTPISAVPEGGSNRKRLSATSVAATLFNSGKHLYFERSWPSWYQAYDQPLHFLPYKEYSGVGRWIGNVRVQHLGHLYGLHGGPAQVAVAYQGVEWRIKCVPCCLYWVIDFDGSQAVFYRERVVLPRQLLSHG